MEKVVLLSVKKDQQELIFSLLICPDNALPNLAIENAKLSGQGDLESYYNMWKSSFHKLQTRGYEGWEIDSTVTTQRSTLEGEEACQKFVKLLEDNFYYLLLDTRDNQWRKIRERLTAEFAKSPDEVRIIIKSDPSLWKLPWHRWDLLEHHPRLGISFSLEDYIGSEINRHSGNLGAVRILAVLGDKTNINLEPDRNAIATLNGASPEFLDQPTAQAFINRLRDEKGWDILFFAGHSQTQGKKGIIYLSETEKLEIDQFRETLRFAIEKGLKIAIFNSCEGSGLVEEAAILQIPTAIFMQEKVPDHIAQFFLKEFLSRYAKQSSLPAAFRYAQYCLEEHTNFPGVTWLPKLYQNPSQIPLTWQQLKEKVKPLKINYPLFSTRRRKPKLKTIFTVSFIVASVVMGVRFLGYLQGYELSAYDYFLNLRPQTESVDPRITIITNDTEDIQYQQELGMELQGSLANQALFQLLDKLKLYHPKVIGLDIYRDNLTELEQLKLAQYIEKLKIIFVCNTGDSKTEYPGVLPPPKIPKNYLGFSDISSDPDGVIRQQILGMSPSSFCPTDKSFSYQIMRYFLEPKLELDDPVLTIEDKSFTKLEKHKAAYHQIRDGGFQVLLNYRAAHQIAQKISLKDVLTGQLDQKLPDLVQGKIVLFGTIDGSYGDYRSTPFSKKKDHFQQVPGVILQAEMISQIISAVSNNRPIIRWFPQWVDALLVGIWSAIGGIIIWGLSNRFQQQLACAFALISLSLLCFSALWKQGYWLPFLPSVLACILTATIVINLRNES